MPEFHETRPGQVFFQVQLPRLIDAMERIAKALEAQNEDYKSQIQREEEAKHPIEAVANKLNLRMADDVLTLGVLEPGEVKKIVDNDIQTIEDLLKLEGRDALRFFGRGLSKKIGLELMKLRGLTENEMEWRVSRWMGTVNTLGDALE